MVINSPNKPAGASISGSFGSRIKIIGLISLTLFMLLGLGGCVTMNDSEASQVYSADTIGTLGTTSSLGQTFISRRPNFNGITVWLTRPPEQTNRYDAANINILSVSLFSAPGDPAPIYTTDLDIPSSGNNLPITIKLPDQLDSAGRGYYLLLANDSNTIQVNGRNEDAYPHGNAFQADQPINADFAFQLTYDYGFSSLIKDARSIVSWIWVIAPLLAVLWLPGWLLLDMSGLRSGYDFVEQIAVAVGISLALIPVLMLWTSVLKVSWSGIALFIAVGFLIGLFLVRIIYSSIIVRMKRSRLPGGQSENHHDSSEMIRNHNKLYSLALLLVFLAALAVRLIMVRDLATPAWVDSVHHALLTRLILNTGAYPTSYLPYFSIAPTSYHLGFHSIAASFIWLSRLDLPHALLILGQVLNALTVFSVYLFSNILTRNRLAGLFAAIITGFLTPMPAYYSSWGRYTELMGILLLPVILSLISKLLIKSDTRKTGWIIGFGALTAGGLFMIHYRVLAFLVSLVLFFIIIQLIRRDKETNNTTTRILLAVGIMASLGIILVFPWFIQTIKTNLLPYLTPVSNTSTPFSQDFSWPYLTSALGRQAMILAGLGLIWGVIKLKRLSFIIPIWVISLFIIANLGALKLPGGGLINNTSVEIMLFIPISILGGYFLAELINFWQDLIPSPFIFPAFTIVTILTVFVAFLGARQLIPILNPITILTRYPDLPALQWVRENIPQDETIVINPFAWGYGLYAGQDGGYWISALAGQPTIPPPVIYGLSQEAPQLTEISRHVFSLSNDPPALWEYMHSHQLNYIYIGARGGVISPQKIAASALFHVLYYQDGVWVFSIKP